jgi:diacylglycerol kinase
MDPMPTPKRTWADKFRDAFRGVRLGVSGQSSFVVHGLVTVLVLIAGVVLRVSQIEWCILVLCITNVLAVEMLNSALESLAKTVDDRYNAALGKALDVASGAVLVTAFGAATIGVMVFVPHLWPLLIG